MITWKKGFLLGDTAKKSGRKIISNIKKNKFQTGVYIVTLASNGTDVFDIIPSFMINPDEESCTEILAVAKGKDEAKELCGQLIMEAYEKTGGFNIRGYYS